MVQIIVSVAVAFVLIPVLTWKLTARLNGYLTSRFPPDTAYVRESSRLLELSQEGRYKKYVVTELFLFIIVFAAILVFYITWPITRLNHVVPNMVGKDLRWPFIPYMLGGILASVPHTAYICNYAIRSLFRLFNPGQDSRVLFFGSRVMNPATAGYRAEYNIIDGHVQLAIVLTAVWLVCLVLVVNTYAVYTADSLILKNGPFQQVTTYRFADIAITETSRKTYTPARQSPHTRHRISFSREGSNFYSTALSDRPGTMEEKIYRTLLPHIGNYSPVK